MKKQNAFMSWIETFTLIELMIIVAVISILLSVIIPCCSDPCSDYVVNKCYAQEDDNPFNKNPEKICIRDIKDDYMKYDKHIDKEVIKDKADKCQFLNMQRYTKEVK